MKPPENYLYYGDNLEIMKKLLQENSSFIDLIYIDPPFNSKKNYNILYKNRFNEADQLQIEAFKDTWSNVEYTKNIEEIKSLGLIKIDNYLKFIEDTMPDSYVSYLSMMAIRIYYMRQLLKKTGSFYLHCDSTMSHYLKTLCDLIFGNENFRNEIVWRRSYSHNDGNKFGVITDTIFFYSKTKIYFYNKVFIKRTKDETEKEYPYIDENTRKRYKSVSMNAAGQGKAKCFGKRGMLEPATGTHWRWSQDRINEGLKNDIIFFTSNNTPRYKQFATNIIGKQVQNLWTDFMAISSQAKERLGYPTQKPLALLERIIQASSNKGDLVADFFCGCGTTVDEAVNLDRKFMGADISTLSVALIEKRLKDRHGFLEGKDYKTDGLPKNIEQAKKLAEKDKFEFQDWVVTHLINGVPNDKKTGDGGIDGFFYFQIPTQKKSSLCLLEIKGGKNLSITQVRSFIKTCQEKGNAGLLLTMGNITDGMKKECYALGNIAPEIPKCDIISIKDLLEAKKPQILFYNITQIRAEQSNRSLL